jgi:uncharacterized protein involved in outer membrane biogenesis
MKFSPDSPQSADQPQRARPPRRVGLLSLALWIAGGLAAVVGLYAALGFWVAPRVIRAQVVSQIAERYHRKASLGEVRFNPFTLKLEADRFNLPDADGKQMIGFDRLTVDASIASIWRRGLAFNEIGLDAPRLRLVRRVNGRLNIQDLIPPPSGKPPPKVMIDHLAIRRGRAEVVDLARSKPFAKTFTPIGFTLNNFSTVKDGAAYALNAVSERGEGLAWRGALGLSPLASQGTFALTKVKLAPLAELAGDEILPFGLTRGDLDLSGGYRFAMKGEKLALGVDVGDLKLTGVGLRARGADADWVTLPAVAVSKVHVDVPTQTVSVGLIEATGPTVTAWTEPGGAINLARYAGPAKARGPPSGKAVAPAWKVDLPELRVRGGKIAFEERSAATPVSVTATPLDVTVTGLALPLAKPVGVEASTGLQGGGRLAAKGTVTLDKVSADLAVEAADIDLPRFRPYIENAVGLKLLSGRVSGKGRVGLAVDGAAKFDGAVRIDNLHTVDKVLEQDFVNWRALRLEGVSARTQPLAVKVREVVAQEPYARVVIGPNYVMNVATVLNPKGAAQVVAPPPKSVKVKFSLFGKKPKRPPPPRPKATQRAALPIEIALVRIEKGRMDFSDLSIEPHFVAGIQELNGTIKGLSGRQDARAAVDLAGQVDRYAPVKIDGQVNYFAATSFTDVKMSFKNMELTTFSPYSGKFAGYRINKGKLNVDLNYKIDDQKLDANHRVVINQLGLGEKVDSADAVKLPMKLIVALLKDRNGVIDIPVAISGTLDDPKFKVWPVIWQVVRNLFTKIATAPFALLGSLGGSGEELQYIDFAPGAGVLDPAAHEKVAALAKALTEHSALNLEIPMPVSPSLDGPALVDARFKAELTAAAAERSGKRAEKGGGVDAALADPRTRRAVLEDLYRKQVGSKPDIPKPQATEGGAKPDANQAAVGWLEEKLRARIAVTDQDLKQLGRVRAEAVQAALLGDGKIEPSRIFVTAQPPLDATTAPVRMKLSLS